MQYQVIKVEATLGTQEEPLLYNVVPQSDSWDEALISELERVNWDNIFPNMRPNDVGVVTIESHYANNR